MFHFNPYCQFILYKSGLHFPGTELYNQLKREGRLLTDNYWDKCTLFDVNFIPKNFSVMELESEFEYLMKNIYSKQLVTDRKKQFKKHY